MVMEHLALIDPESLLTESISTRGLLDVNGRFARDLDYLFVAQCIVEAKQVLDDGTILYGDKSHLDSSQLHKPKTQHS